MVNIQHGLYDCGSLCDIPRISLWLAFPQVHFYVFCVYYVKFVNHLSCLVASLFLYNFIQFYLFGLPVIEKYLIVNFFSVLIDLVTFLLLKIFLKYFKNSNQVIYYKAIFVVTLSPCIILNIILCCFFILFYITVFDLCVNFFFLCVNVITAITSFKIGLTIFYVKLRN